ncbi:MAG: phosphotransferase enzyme family protein [Anaerolineae bacterium]
MITLDASFVTAHWPLTAVSLGQHLPAFSTRRVVRVHAAEGEYVLKIDDQPPPEREARQAHEVLRFLARRRYPHAPRPLDTRDGSPQVWAEGGCASMMEYIDGGSPESTPETWSGLGEIARRLNAITGCPVPYGVPAEGAIEELSREARDHPARERFQAAVAMLPPLLEYPRKGLLHGEINVANAIRRRNGALVLIDWDEAGTGPAVLEPGYPLLCVFLTEDLRLQQPLASAFYGAYYAAGKPDADEQDLLFRAALLHALRYAKYGDTQRRWLRIEHALEHRKALLAAALGR